jgi:hypothetical protein
MSSRIGFLSAACFAAMLFAGCSPSGPKLYKIKGQVTHQGKPVKYVYISFVPDDPNTMATATGSADENGYFELMIGSTPGVYPGGHTVTAQDPLIAVGATTSKEPDFLAVIAKYGPGKSTMKFNVEKNESNLELKMD